jgi:hypothetical protein
MLFDQGEHEKKGGEKNEKERITDVLPIAVSAAVGRADTRPRIAVRRKVQRAC